MSGLRNVLRHKRREWDMVFALGPYEAMARLGETSFDVVVSDMRMPGMDGATLLARVRESRPGTVRIILTGQAEQESMVKAAFIAHLFLSKPCEPALLVRAVDRACHLNELLAGEELRAAAGEVDMLPTAPKTYLALNEALTRQDCSASDVAFVVERDIALCAKILQIVNSAYFGMPRRIVSLADAVSYLGTMTIKNLTMALEAFAQASPACGLSPKDLVALENQSLLTGRVARRLAQEDKVLAEEAFLAGLLHKIGCLVPAKAPLAAPVDRALLGAYLLSLWGLPHAITEAVAYHERPRSLPHDGIALVDIIYLAQHLVCEAGPVCVPESGSASPPLDLEYAGKLGFGPARLDEARGIVSNFQMAG